MSISSIHRSVAVAAGVLVAAPGVIASDVRGTLQGVEGLVPTAVTAPARFHGSYWETPNGVVRPGAVRASAEWDVAVVVTGPGITEATQPVNLRVEGGRCRPGTVVVSPGTVVQVDNRDVLGHELYAVPAGSAPGADRVVPAEVTSAGTRRQVTFPAAGVFELRDVRQPTFRCWVIAGPGQGRVLSPGTDNGFTVAGLADGDYTATAYFEGTARGTTALHVAGRDAQATLAIAPPAGAPGSTPGSTPGSAPGSAAPAGATAPAETTGNGREHRR